MSLLPAAFFGKQPLLSPELVRSASLNASNLHTKRLPSSHGPNNQRDNQGDAGQHGVTGKGIAKSDAPHQTVRKSIDTVVAQGIGQILRSAKDVLLETASFALRSTRVINARQDRVMRDFVNKQIGAAIRKLYIEIPKSLSDLKEAEASGSKAWIIAARIAYRTFQLSVMAYPILPLYFKLTDELFDRFHKLTASPSKSAPPTKSATPSASTSPSAPALGEPERLLMAA